MLRTELTKFHVSSLMLLLKRDARGNLKIDLQISQVLRHYSLLFAVKDICNFVEIWDLSHAHRIQTIVQKVFGDMDGTSSVNTTENFTPDEADRLLLEDWNDLRLDDELAKMAMDKLTLAEIDDSQGESFDNMP